MLDNTWGMRLSWAGVLSAVGFRRRLVHALAGLCSCYLGYWSLRASYAEYLGSGSSSAAEDRAIRLAPGNALYQSQLAETAPNLALSAIQKAVELNPRNSSLWIQYSSVAETNGDFQRAEACLLHAVRLDKTFAPRWLLAEYYFRRQDLAHFLPAVKAALATSYDDVTPLFQDCWELTSDADVILGVIPERADVLSQYLNFLVNDKKALDLALPVAARLAKHTDPESAAPMLNFCDRLLERERPAEAVGIWNGLARSRVISYAPLAPESGAVLTNHKLAQPFLERGFDWRAPQAEGVYVRAGRASPGLQFTFSGRQPEQCELLTQWIPITGGRRYELGVRYQTEDLQGDTGINWRVLNAHTGVDLLRGGGRLIASAGAEKSFVFEAPAGARLARLVCGYARVLGTERISGSVSLSGVSLRFAE